MPEGFDKMREAIKKSLVEQGIEPEEAEKRSWAIATKQWNEKQGG